MDPEGLRKTMDLIVIGAGPAGLSAGYAAERAGLRYLILEADRIGNTIHNFPLGKRLFSDPEELEFEPETFPPTQGKPTREKLLLYLEGFSREKRLKLQVHNRVLGIRREANFFRFKAEHGSYSSRYAILAIGIDAVPNKLGVPGEELPKVHYRLREASPFAGKRVLVVGGGDSALEAAMALEEASARVTLSYRRKRFRRPQKVNLEPFMEKVAAGRIEAIYPSHVRAIGLREVTLEFNGGASKALPNEVVIVQAGTMPPLEFFQKLGLTLRGRYPAYDESTFETTTRGLFVAGHITREKGIANAISHGPKIIGTLLREGK